MSIKYLKVFADGTKERVDNAPSYGVESNISDYYKDGVWYDNTGTKYTTQFTYASQDGKLVGFEVADGEVVDIHLEDTESNVIAPSLSLPALGCDNLIANEKVIAEEFKGKNACTAWVNFDGTTTPPTIRDSYNVSGVVRTGTGQYDIYFEEPMDNTSYSIQHSLTYSYSTTGVYQSINRGQLTNKISIQTVNASNASTNCEEVTIEIKGGRD